MGVVHAAYDVQLDRVIALKTLRAERTGADDVGRFIREGQALARLSHPNVVPIYEVGAAGGQVFLAMEYIRGHTLRDVFAEGENECDGRDRAHEVTPGRSVWFYSKTRRDSSRAPRRGPIDATQIERPCEGMSTLNRSPIIVGDWAGGGRAPTMSTRAARCTLRR